MSGSKVKKSAGSINSLACFNEWDTAGAKRLKYPAREARQTSSGRLRACPGGVYLTCKSFQILYYMLSYAFRVLKAQGYENMGTEEFHNVSELCAAILVKGFSKQLKQGLSREYITEADELSVPRGKIDISESIKKLSMQRRKLVCVYDDFSVNYYLNQIIKTTMCILLKFRISSVRRKEIRKLLVYLGDIDVLDIHSINWNIQYNRNNQTYRMLVFICYLIIKGLLQSQTDGSVKMMDFLDEQRMYHLYEKFILEYYRQEFPDIEANASRIDWMLDDWNSDMLPVMQSDITLSHGGRILIIDAKYYANSLQYQYDKYSIISGNLYQIFTYVKNKDAEMAGVEHIPVAGMLLYAKTDEENYPQNKYRMSGNAIEVRTLDLSGDFSGIRRQLDGIAEEYLGITAA